MATFPGPLDLQGTDVETLRRADRRPRFSPAKHEDADVHKASPALEIGCFTGPAALINCGPRVVVDMARQVRLKDPAPPVLAALQVGVGGPAGERDRATLSTRSEGSAW